MRYTKAHIARIIDMLNTEAKAAGVTPDFEADYLAGAGGYKLTRRAGAHDMWVDRAPAREFRRRIAAMVMGMSLARMHGKPTNGSR